MSSARNARFRQISKFRPELGWAGKNRKEIELSIQKTKNGILPTVDFGSLTRICLQL